MRMGGFVFFVICFFWFVHVQIFVYTTYYHRLCVHIGSRYCTVLSIRIFGLYRKPKLPVEMEPVEDDDLPNVSWDTEDILEHVAKMGELRKSIYDKAKRNINAAQKEDNFYYDRKHSDSRVCSNIILNYYHSTFIKPAQYE